MSFYSIGSKPASTGPVTGESEVVDPSVPAWKAELAIRKSQRKITPPKASDSELPSTDVPQWKKELMEKKRQKTAQTDDDPTLAGLPPWKQELLRKKKEKVPGGFLNCVENY